MEKVGEKSPDLSHDQLPNLVSRIVTASRHGDTLVSPVNFWVVMGKPQMSDDDGLLSEVGDCEACFLRVLAILEYDLNFLCDGSILIWGSIYIVNWYWVWQGASLQLMLLGKGSVDKHPFFPFVLQVGGIYELYD